MKFNNIVLFFFSSVALYSQSQNYQPKVDSVLSLMTLDEKIGQLNQLSGDWEQTGPTVATEDKKEAILKGFVGSMLNVHGAETTRHIQELAMQSRLRIPLIFAQDVIHGYRTTFPIPLAEAASFDLNLIEKASRIAATEAASAGIHWTFAPMVDISRDPRWGRVMEGAGEDTYLNSLVAEARVKGFQGDGIGSTDAVMACAKHFVGYGAAQAGRDYHTTDISERSLREYYFPPFEAAIKAGVASFMTSFNDLNGIPSTGNVWLYKNILRDEWGYDGLVVSDWGAIGELIPHTYAANLSDAALKAINAGVDIDMESRAYVTHLKSLVESGKVSVAAIDEIVKRILLMKFKLGLFDDPYRFCNPVKEDLLTKNATHRQIALDVAKRSIVLLKNENQVLPLDGRYKTIAVIGPLAKSKEDMRGGWSINRWPVTELVSPLEGIQAALPENVRLLYAKGCDIQNSDRKGFKEALKIASKADIVLYIGGESWTMTGEAKSRTDISLPGVQEELMKEIKQLNKPLVALLLSGRPMTFEWTAENADAILYPWWLGNEAGNAIASVLFGNHNPSARLPMTFPRSVGQIPLYYNMKSTGRPISPDGNISYKSAYIDQTNTPRYEFGFGLSYTKFEYSDLRLDKKKIDKNDRVQVQVNIKNTGGFDGSEVAQLYLRDKVGSVTRPVKELKGFQHVFIPKGGDTTLTFTLDQTALSFYNQDMKLVAEPGEFEVLVGSSSNDIRCKDSFELIERAPESKNILVIGDSNSATSGCWVDYFKQMNSDDKICNLAIYGNTIGFNNCGRDTLNTLFNIDSYIERAKKSLTEIDVVIVMLGTNDCKAEFSGNTYEVANNMERLLNRLRNSFPSSQLMLVLPPPMGDDYELDQKYKGGKKRLIQLNKEFVGLSQRLGVTVVDAFTAMENDFTNLNSDGVHLNANGHQLLASLINKQIRKRAFIIGDSISIHYGPYLQSLISDSFYYDRKRDNGEEKAENNLDDPQGANGGNSRMVREYLNNLISTKRLTADVLILNCGLHDIKTNAKTGEKDIQLNEYVENLDYICALLKSAGVKFLWVNSTPVNDKIHNRGNVPFYRYDADVRIYNEEARKVMQKHGVKVIDLYGLSKSFPVNAYMDHVHYREVYREKQANLISEALFEEVIN